MVLGYSRYLLGVTLQSWKYKAVLAISLVGYWLLYSFSSGMIDYPDNMVNPVLYFRNPYFIKGDLFNSGIIWLPAKYLQVSLPAGQVPISLLLSILFALNIVLAIHLLRMKTASRKLGLIGVLGLAPTFFSSGMACCSAPFGTLLVGVFVPSASTALTALAFNSSYSLASDAIIGTAMFLSFLYTPSRIRHCSALAC